MKQTQSMGDFEGALLSYVETCYSVALTLTRNPYDARDLTRDVLIWAWHRRDKAESKLGIKTKLLAMVRQRFLENYPVAAVSFAPLWDCRDSQRSRKTAERPAAKKQKTISIAPALSLAAR